MKLYLLHLMQFNDIIPPPPTPPPPGTPVDSGVYITTLACIVVFFVYVKYRNTVKN